MSMKDSRSPALPYRLNAVAAAVSTALTGGTVAAQERAGAVIEEITVTATKREESLQDIPLYVTAFTTEDIARRGFKGIDDYARQIPDLAFARREPAGTSVVFRGVAASGIQFGTNPSSGVYLDEQPITVAGLNPNPRLIDIERLEALSGPQGTLFGDASQSGTLRIITNKPDPVEFDAWVEAGASAVEEGDVGYDVSGMVNIPLVQDKLALRLVGFYEQEAGYIDNVLSPTPGGDADNASLVEDDVNEVDYKGGRASLRWTPDDRWTVDVSAIFQDVEADGFGDTEFDRQDNLEQIRFKDERFDEDWYQLGLTIESKLGFGDALLSVSYFDRELRYEADGTEYQFAFQVISDTYEADFNAGQPPGYEYDFYFYDFRPLGQTSGGGPVGFANNEEDNERWTIEARLATPAESDSRWRGIIGAFYQHLESQTFFDADVENFVFPSPYYANTLAGSKAFYYIAYNPYNLSINGLPPGSFEKSSNWFYGLYDQEIDQYAVFGEASFDVTDNFTIAAGGRWYRVERDVSTLLGALQQGPVPNRDTDFITNDDTGKETDDGFVPKVTLTYRFDNDNIVYGTYSEGFRSGGANALRPNSVLPRAFDSDEVQNLEFGTKTTWLDQRLYLNLTAYWMVWDDIQVQVNDPQPTVFQLGIVNFPEAEIKGLQAAFEWVPAKGWNVSGNIAYNDAEISESATLFANTANPISAVDGTDLPITPDWKASLGIEYYFDQRLLDAQPFARLDLAYTGDSINALQGLEATVVSPPPTEQESYSIGELRVGLDSDQWLATLYVTNLWDERGQQFINNRYAARRVSLTRPRTWGVNFRWRF